MLKASLQPVVLKSKTDQLTILISDIVIFRQKRVNSSQYNYDL